MKALWLSFAFTICFHPFAHAQNCPAEDPNGPSKESAAQILHGLVVLHDGIRRWVELQPDKPVCEQTSIQLLDGGGGAFEVDEGNSRHIETLRGCRITVNGPLGIPGTGYYSAPIYMNVSTIKEDAGCVRQPQLRDYAKARPDPGVRRYQVAMHIDYRGDGKIDATITSAGRTHSPWQAYASYFFTGGYVLYGYCANGFQMSRVSGTPAAKPWQIDEMAAMDPETPASKGIWNMTLRYTCSRYRGQ